MLEAILLTFLLSYLATLVWRRNIICRTNEDKSLLFSSQRCSSVRNSTTVGMASPAACHWLVLNYIAD